MKLKTEYPFDGLVWEIPMTQDLGYAYVQTIDLRPTEPGFSSYLLKILDYRSINMITKFDINFFVEVDMLTSHLLFKGRPPQRQGDVKWKALGYLPIVPFDRIVPEFKLLSYESEKPFSYNEIPQYATWSVYWQSSLADYYKEMATFDQVKHLGWLTHFNVAFIHHRITMEWMRKLGLDYNQYFTSQWDTEFLMGQKYQVKSTVLFSEVDPRVRGKAIGIFTK